LRFEDLVRVRLEVSLLKLAGRAGGRTPVIDSGGGRSDSARPAVRLKPVSPAPEPVKPPASEPPKLPPTAPSVAPASELSEASPAAIDAPPPLGTGAAASDAALAGAEASAVLDPAACWPGFLNELLRREPFFHAPLQQGGLQEIRTAEKPPVLVVGINNLFEQDLLKKNSRRLSEIWQECYGMSVRFEAVRLPEKGIGRIPGPPPGLKETASKKVRPPAPAAPPAGETTPAREIPATGTGSASLSPDEEAMVRRIQGIMGGEVKEIFKE